MVISFTRFESNLLKIGAKLCTSYSLSLRFNILFGPQKWKFFTELSAGGQGYAVQQEQPRTVVQSHLAEELMDTEVEEITEEEDSEDDDENVPLASYRSKQTRPFY